MNKAMIDSIGGRDRLEELASFKPSGSNSVNSASREEWMAMARALLAVLDAQPVVLPEPHAHLIWIQAGRGPDDYWDDVEVSRSDKDRCCDGSERYAVYSEFEVKAMLESANVPYEVKKSEGSR